MEQSKRYLNTPVITHDTVDAEDLLNPDATVLKGKNKLLEAHIQNIPDTELVSIKDAVLC